MNMGTEMLPEFFKCALTGLKEEGWPAESEIFMFFPKLSLNQMSVGKKEVINH